jgi:hypothetical protein
MFCCNGHSSTDDQPGTKAVSGRAVAPTLVYSHKLGRIQGLTGLVFHHSYILIFVGADFIKVLDDHFLNK